MTIASRTGPHLSAQVGGSVLQASEIECTDAIAPDIGSATIVVPLGSRSFDGSAQIADPSIEPGAAVTIAASTGGFVWTGEVAVVEERAEGDSRTLVITCQGPAAALERAYVSRAKQRNELNGAAMTVDGARDFNADGNPDRSVSTFTVAGRAVYIHDDYADIRGMWNQAQAIDHLLALASEDAGLPLITLSDPDGALDRETSWQVAGGSVHAAIQAIAGARADVVWRLIGSVLTVRRIPTSGGRTVDLSGPYCRSYSHAKDGRSTVAGARAVGARKVWIITVRHDVAAAILGGAGGDLQADWSSQDVVDMNKGNENSPAFRSFRLSPGMALPDGTAAANARILGVVPWRVTSVSGGAVLGGVQYGSPIGVFAKRDSRFVDLTAQVSAMVRPDQAGLLFQAGVDWRVEYLKSDEIFLTIAVESISRVTANLAGGEGTQRGALDLPGLHVRAISAGIGVGSGGSLVTVTQSFRDDTTRATELLAAWSAQMLTHRKSLAWTEIGVAGGSPDPMDLISGAVVRSGDGTTLKTLACNTVVSRRTVRWTEAGCETSWSSAPLPADLNAVAGKAR